MTENLRQLDNLFWFFPKRGAGLNFEKDKHLIIHQTLALGSADDVRALFRECGEDEIKKEFQNPVKGLYHPAVLELFQNILKVHLKNKSLYIKDIHGQFASGNIGR
jgi:hypothetical protein